MLFVFPSQENLKQNNKICICMCICKDWEAMRNDDCQKSLAQEGKK